MRLCSVFSCSFSDSIVAWRRLPRERRSIVCATARSSSWKMNSVMRPMRSEEHTSELQSLMRISYAVFCLKKKNKQDKSSNDVDPHHRSNTYQPGDKLRDYFRSHRGQRTRRSDKETL